MQIVNKLLMKNSGVAMKWSTYRVKKYKRLLNVQNKERSKQMR